MTGRVCPVHGEYAPTGICRWCEPEEAPAQELARINAGVVGEAPGARALRDVKAYAGMLGPPPKPLPDESAVAKAVREYYATRRGLRAPISWRIEYEDPARVAARDAAEESRLLAQHAALRWERVARRWNYKHRNHKGLNERERAYVWRCWLAQQQRIFEDGEWLRRQQERFIAVGIPKRWP